MYFSSLTTVTAAASPVSMPLSNAQISSFLFDFIANSASTWAANGLGKLRRFLASK